jgi:hypothetical protein
VLGPRRGSSVCACACNERVSLCVRSFLCLFSLVCVRACPCVYACHCERMCVFVHFHRIASSLAFVCAPPLCAHILWHGRDVRY